jgi:hypothetical protein
MNVRFRRRDLERVLALRNEIRLHHGISQDGDLPLLLSGSTLGDTEVHVTIVKFDCSHTKILEI